MSPRATVLPLLCALFLLLGGSSASARAAPLSGFDDYAHTALREWNVPGLAVSVVKDGKGVLAKGYGVRKVGGSAPVDPGTTPSPNTSRTSSSMTLTSRASSPSGTCSPTAAGSPT